MGELSESYESKINSILGDNKSRTVSIAPLLLEVRNKEVYKDAGYEKYSDYCKDKFNIGNTQAKVYPLVAERYGEYKNGRREIPEEFHPFGVDKLYEISKFDDFNEYHPMDTIEEHGITVDTTSKEIKKMVKAFNNGEEYKEEVKLKGIEDICYKLKGIDGTLKLLGLWGKNKNISDHEYRIRVLEMLNRLGIIDDEE